MKKNFWIVLYIFNVKKKERYLDLDILMFFFLCIIILLRKKIDICFMLNYNILRKKNEKGC